MRLLATCYQLTKELFATSYSLLARRENDVPSCDSVPGYGRGAGPGDLGQRGSENRHPRVEPDHPGCTGLRPAHEAAAGDFRPARVAAARSSGGHRHDGAAGGGRRVAGVAAGAVPGGHPVRYVLRVRHAADEAARLSDPVL